MNPVEKILGLVECELCYGEGTDDKNRTCKKCDGTGSYVK